MPSEIVMSISLIFAALGWLLFAHSQNGRFPAIVLAWLSVPFIALAILYAWAALNDPAIEMQPSHARYGIMTISISQAAVLIILSLLQRGRHGYK